MKKLNKYMEIAINEARLGMIKGDGGPFGAVIVKDGEIVARSHNQVLLTHDPTMHAEIAAIREACAKFGRFDLSDCEIYSTCLPCPMCLGAIMWAKMPKLYYGAVDSDAAAAGFDDEYIYDVIKNGLHDKCSLSAEETDADECRKLFAEWMAKDNREMY